MILITGASSGIGQACARLYAEKGNDVFLVARRKDRLEKLGTQLGKKYGVKALTQDLDVMDRSALVAFSKKHSKNLSKVKVFINNAGLALGIEPIQGLSFDSIEKMISTNLTGFLGITQVVLPHFLKSKSGHLVHMGSVAGNWAYPHGNVYCATKSAVSMLTECFRLDLQGSGIRVSEICPGMVESEFSNVRLGDDQKAKAVYQGFKPLTPKDIAEIVFFTTQAPAHVNIQQIVVYPTAQAAPGFVARSL
jgi:3-hydroxy acid dehydrogenase/malonic semialdehyde reductase